MEKVKPSDIRAYAATLNAKERAQYLDEVITAIYDSVKVDNPEGDGLDGRWGPQREGIGKVLDKAKDWEEEVLKRKLS